MPPVWLGISNEDPFWKGEKNRVSQPVAVILAQTLPRETGKGKTDRSKGTVGPIFPLSQLQSRNELEEQVYFYFPPHLMKIQSRLPGEEGMGGVRQRMNGLFQWPVFTKY